MKFKILGVQFEDSINNLLKFACSKQIWIRNKTDNNHSKLTSI